MSENVARRRMRRVFPGSAAVMMLAAVALSGCGGDPTLYTVAATPGVSTPGGPLVVEVRTPVVSASIDRDEIVRQEQDYKLHMAKGDTWSAPLGDMIGRTLTRDLAQRLPGTTVFAQNDAVSTMPLGFVELTVTAFNTDQQGRAVLEAMLAVHGVHGTIGPVLTVPVQLSMKLDGHATGMLVAALSQMLGQVADIAAQHIRTLPVALPPVQAASL